MFLMINYAFRAASFVRTDPTPVPQLSWENHNGTRLTSNSIRFQHLLGEVVHLSVEMKGLFWNAWLRDAFMSHLLSDLALIVHPLLLSMLIETTSSEGLVLFTTQECAERELDWWLDHLTRPGRPR
jgi:hypothetical protein